MNQTSQTIYNLSSAHLVNEHDFQFYSTHLVHELFSMS